MLVALATRVSLGVSLRHVKQGNNMGVVNSSAQNMHEVLTIHPSIL